MIIATTRIFANSGNINEMLEVLSSITGQTKDKTGCIYSVIHQDANNKRHITYEERWETQEHLNNHIRSNLYLNILAVIDMSDPTPTVEFCTVSVIKGMEVINATR